MWKFGPQVEQVLQEYDNLRYRLMPYIYFAAWSVTSQGGTMMQGLPLVYPDDKDVWGISDEFMFGSSLLINPVTEPGATKRNVYLPKGSNWVDFWTGAMEKGGRTIEGQAPIDRMPIIVKAGSILLLGPIVDSTKQKQDPVDIRIYPGQDGSALLYEDEGDSYRYEKGNYSTIAMAWSDRSHTLLIGPRKGSFPGILAERTFRLFLVGDGHGTGIQSGNNPDRVIHYDGHPLSLHLAGGHLHVEVATIAEEK
jgi:alpha-D-xyloside xylohydrolase